MWARRFAGSILNSRLASGITQLGRPLLPTATPISSAFALPKFSSQQTRGLQNLQPRRRKYKKAQKGRVPVRTGGSTKGNYMAYGDYGLRVKLGLRLSAKTISAIHVMLKRKLKAIKGLRIWLRVFPDIPVSTKGTEIRMGKGKGAFDYWACRVPKDKIIFEMCGPGLNTELAKDAIRQAGFKLGVPTEFVIANDQTRQPKKEDMPPTTIPFLHAK
ncbi:39S ribosomal protein L16, mitochondrial [Coemansia sp. RSA 2671]|uniref:39S ribosomal protein L16, mitochondrial n=2 Tax=Coemansia TaxID=4863 RepID=A0A9W8L5D8_9FUNG|nr:39S ribosomal protein L16, mitochondrial [Coemansia sp. RSA 2675]KAJ2015620.1 39S ribosomal protein L16, mitochondrial [Coemansia sp. S85]KAJ2347993.1 39S ribosomal protein L16, mitochondrial [Coemansia sp. RSA 2671]KAJ2414717.1 39S ribosomal protein L16, mitochondrial [Coemansia sp. RSA 2530]KAJ2688344.1 39S ribosomal protein L16, mitochondrial [Coemansia spiralis]KAJ2702020.1 39S ribosomal protein L16, mitochondrial [Coemansia sp. IMI 209128]KAJ2790587.1 39S ribosomal protein L16, mitoch